jgi:hypothetical protein
MKLHKHFPEIKRLIFAYWGDVSFLVLFIINRFILALRYEISFDTEWFVLFILIANSACAVLAVIHMLRRRCNWVRYISYLTIFAGQILYAMTFYYIDPILYLVAFVLLWVSAILVLIRFFCWAKMLIVKKRVSASTSEFIENIVVPDNHTEEGDT